jgi:hypothetical protein
MLGAFAGAVSDDGSVSRDVRLSRRDLGATSPLSLFPLLHPPPTPIVEPQVLPALISAAFLRMYLWVASVFFV